MDSRRLHLEQIRGSISDGSSSPSDTSDGETGLPPAWYLSWFQTRSGTLSGSIISKLDRPSPNLVPFLVSIISISGSKPDLGASIVNADIPYGPVEHLIDELETVQKREKLWYHQL